MKVTTLCLLLLGLMSVSAISMTTKSKNADDAKTKPTSRRLILVPKTVYVPHYTSGDANGGPYEAYLAPKVEETTSTIFLAPQVAPPAPAAPAASVAPKVPTMQYSPPVGYHYPPPPSYFTYPSYPGYPGYQPIPYLPQVPIMNQYSSYSYFGMGPQYPAVPLDFQSPMSGYVGTTSSITGSSLPVSAESAHVDQPTTE